MSLSTGNITNIYDIFDMKMPKKVIVAMYLIKQFECMDFNYNCIE